MHLEFTSQFEMFLLNQFLLHREYTDLYAPIVIDSSSCEEDEIEQATAKGYSTITTNQMYLLSEGHVFVKTMLLLENCLNKYIETNKNKDGTK